MKIAKIISIIWFLFPVTGLSQATANKPGIPKSLSSLYTDEDDKMYILSESGMKLFQTWKYPRYTLPQMKGSPVGTETGIAFDFKNEGLNGRLFFGLINYSDSKHPHPVYHFQSSNIEKGKTSVNFNHLRGRYDMTGWEKSGKGTIGYRVINQYGSIIYDGKLSFTGTGPFEVVNTIISGPFINLLKPDGVTISFETSEKSKCEIEVDNMIFKDKTEVTQHEIEISGLEPDTRYSYTIRYGELEQSYAFKTSPLPGTRKRFAFSYSSDSRGGSGWGERNLYGANVYIAKKIMAVSAQYGVAFAQFTGDLITGYLTSRDEMLLQYHNWKNSVAPFAHHFQVTMGMGNHESYNLIFRDTIRQYNVSIDKFPYDTESSEALFSSVVVNPHNGPESEDGSNYDPDPGHKDFPSYDENVFYYTYDNVAIVCLNSNYWYTRSTFFVPTVGGNIHGYVMDNQLNWFKKTLRKFEKDPTIDHVFVTIHTPLFPNGGHVSSDMWYNGNNTYRPWIAGQPVEEGIIERRDQLLDLAINHSDKVVAFLTGDEHNYCKTELGPGTQIYPEDYTGGKITLKRTLYQINNGAGGAPYYARENTPWTPFVSGFSTQTAVCLFTIEGKNVEMVVINPDTLEEVDKLKLR
ncbi:hypothetical protein ES705_34141 [subsurface metagenome]